MNSIYFDTQKSKKYPRYIFMIWILSWAFFFLIGSVNILFNLSNNGYMVKVDECLNSDSMSSYCEKEGVPLYEPVGKVLKRRFISSGTGTGFIVMLFGVLSWRDRKRKEKEYLEIKEILKKAIEEKQILSRFAKYKLRDFVENFTTKEQIIKDLKESD